MKPKPLPPLDDLKECFLYDHMIGALVWKERPLRRDLIQAGRTTSGDYQ